METLFAYCGLQCRECPAYLATISGNVEQKAEVAKNWSTQFGVSFTADDINCAGCKPEGAKFSHCANCEIKKCNVQKGFANCGICDEYPCNKLEHIISTVPTARDILDAVNLAKKI